jgi:TorA maturation chaperone TorD
MRAAALCRNSIAMEQMQDQASGEAVEQVIDEVDRARAQEYALLATLLARSPDAQMLRRLALVRGDASALGVAHTALGEVAARVNAEDVEREYDKLFGVLGRGELLPYASYYLTGSFYGLPLARLRGNLASLGVARAEGHAEPEDHAAILCEIMAGIAGGHIAAPAEAERAIFEKHLAPWMGRFFADLERAESAEFYARVGAIGRIFIDIETEAFALST